jgi:hypothetical protein
MQVHADPDPKHCLYHSSIVRKPGSSLRFLAGSRSVLKGTVALVCEFGQKWYGIFGKEQKMEKNR